MPQSLQKRRSPLARSAFALMMAATATAFWLLLGPVSVGGTFAMASVSGSSMSPTLTDGDLVLLRKHGEYGVGDVAAYTHPDIGLVLHRIVERDAEGFTLRGDNRTAVDSYRPTAEEIVGSRWLRIPAGGRVLQDVLKPRNAALLAIAGMVLSGAAAGATRSRSRPDHGRRDRFRFAALSGYGPIGQSIGGPLTMTLVGALSVLLVVQVHGPTALRSVPVALTERGTLAYESVASGGIYDGIRVTAPSPLFRALTDEVPVTFSFALESDPDVPIEVDREARLFAEVRHANGWKRTVPLSSTAVSGLGDLELSGVIDLTVIDWFVAQFESVTGIFSGLYSLAVIAEVSSNGTLDGQAFQRDFRQEMRFRMTELQLQFEGDQGLTLETESTVMCPVVVERTLPLPMFGEISHAMLRIIAIAVAAVASGGLLLIALFTLPLLRDEAARIRARYGKLLVTGSGGDFSVEHPIRVDDFDALVRVAESNELPIVHVRRDTIERYFVFEDTKTYSYTIFKRRGAAQAADDAVFGQEL